MNIPRISFQTIPKISTKPANQTNKIFTSLNSLNKDTFVSFQGDKSEKIDLAVKKYAPLIQNDTVENLFALDKDGNLIPELTKKGSKDFVGITRSEESLISKKGNCILLHNHPEEVTLGSTDVANIFKYNLSQIIAVTPGKGFYAMKAPKQFSDLKKEQIISEIERIKDKEDAIMSMLKDDFSASRAEKLKVLNEWRKRNWEELASKYKLEYTHNEGEYISTTNALPLTKYAMYYDIYDD